MYVATHAAAILYLIGHMHAVYNAACTQACIYVLCQNKFGNNKIYWNNRANLKYSTL